MPLWWKCNEHTLQSLRSLFEELLQQLGMLHNSECCITGLKLSSWDTETDYVLTAAFTWKCQGGERVCGYSKDASFWEYCETALGYIDLAMGHDVLKHDN